MALMRPRAEADLLLVIDVQNVFCPGGALVVPGGDEVVAIINRMAPSPSRSPHGSRRSRGKPWTTSAYACSVPGGDTRDSLGRQCIQCFTSEHGWNFGQPLLPDSASLTKR